MNLGSKLNQIHMDLDPMEKDIRSGKVNVTDDFLNEIVKTTSLLNGMLLVHAEDPEICYKRIKQEIIDIKKDNNNGLLLDRNEDTNTKGNIILNENSLKDIENKNDKKANKEE